MVGFFLPSEVHSVQTNTVSPGYPVMVEKASEQLIPSEQVNSLHNIPSPPLPKPLTYFILISTTLLWICALGVVIKILRKEQWSLKNALEEEANLPVGTPPIASGVMPVMVASASRLIALVGTIILGTFFIAIGYYVLWQLCNGQSIQDALNAWSYFLLGTTLFLPYGINKASSIFK